MKKILFVCAENAGRSQIAQAWFNHLAKLNHLEWVAQSSGTFPAAHVNTMVAMAMQQQDIDISKAIPKKFVDAELNEYDKIVSFGCIVISTLPKAIQERITEWHIDDPHGETMDRVIQIRDEVEAKVEELVNGFN